LLAARTKAKLASRYHSLPLSGEESFTITGVTAPQRGLASPRHWHVATGNAAR
jgi:hypothetical protein